MPGGFNFSKHAISVQRESYSGTWIKRARWLKLLSSIFAITLMASCDGSSSSGSGGASNQFTGTNSGNYTANLPASGVSSNAVFF